MFFQISVSIFFGLVSRSGIAGSCGPIFKFLRNFITVSILSAPIYIPTNSDDCSLLPHPHQNLFVFSLKIAIMADERCY